MRLDNRVSGGTQGCASGEPLECLGIPRSMRPRYDPESPMRLPEFWAGAVAARKQMEDSSENQHERASHADAIRRLEAIQAEVGRVPLAAIPDYARWLAR